jgi:hypothetical protein
MLMVAVNDPVIHALAIRNQLKEPRDLFVQADLPLLVLPTSFGVAPIAPIPRMKEIRHSV